MPRNHRSRRIERLENILAATLGGERELAELEKVARHPENIRALHYIRQRLELIKAETQALYQEEQTRVYQADAP